MTELCALNNSSIHFSTKVLSDISAMRKVGQEEFETFWDDRLVHGKVAIGVPIKKNCFNTMASEQHNKQTKEQVLSQSAVTKLRSAAVYREEKVAKLFSSEIFGVAQSIAENRNTLYHGTKSDILKRFSSTHIPKTNDRLSAVVIECSAQIQAKSKAPVQNMYDFAVLLYNHVTELSKDFDRCDVIADRYFNGSLREATTRTERGIGSRMFFSGNTAFPPNFQDDCLQNSENKEDLNLYLANTFMDLHQNKEKILVFSHKDSILTTDTRLMDCPSIAYCTIEEADARLVRHTLHLAATGYKNIIVRTVDTDVLILLCAYSPYWLNDSSANVYVCFGIGFNMRYYNVREMSEIVGMEKCSGLPFFYAFSGCDMVSSFYKKGKCQFWDKWHSMDDASLNEVFRSLSDSPLIPSRSGLIEHIRRASLQAGWYWKLCVENVHIPDPEVWGWIKTSDTTYIPMWHGYDQSIDLNMVISTCTCTSKVCKRCKCRRENDTCLPFCKCQRECVKKDN